MKKILSVFLLFLVVSLFSADSSYAQEKSWLISQWDTKINIHDDASMDVVDTVTFAFTGSFTFVNRTIDNQKFDAISEFTVKDEQGNLLADHESLTYDSNLEAYRSTIHFSATNESKTFIFSYTIRGGIGYYADHDELYWNILPSDRDVSIGKTTVDVRLPKDVSRTDLDHAFFGEGSHQLSRIIDEGETSYFHYEGEDFGPGSNFTIVAGFPPNIVYNPGIYKITTEPANARIYVNGKRAAAEQPLVLRGDSDLTRSSNTIAIKKFGRATKTITLTPIVGAREEQTITLDYAWWYPLFVILILLYIAHPLAVFIWLIMKWRRTGRDPKGRGTIIAEYDAPDNLPPTLVGILIDERADLHEITASIIDLARRGYIKIKELPKKIWSSKDYELIKLKDFSDASELHPYEKLLLQSTFGHKESVKISQLRNAFYKHLPAIKEALYKEVADRKYFQENPETKRRHYTLSGVVMLALGIITATFFGIGIPLTISGILVMIFGRFMPKRTPEGVRATEHTLGFKEYLYRAERYRVQKLTPEMFEKFLPYAMVFRIESEWAKKFEGIYQQNPSWYESSSPLTTHALVPMILIHNLNSMNNATAAAFVARPGGGGSGASGGSGFSGGFSGGGGGGGGISAG